MKPGHFIAIAFAILLTACTEKSGTVYQVPLPEARRILLATSFPPYLFGTQTPEWEVRGASDSGIVWIVRKNGGEIFRYTGSLKEESQGSTRVSIDVKAATSGPDEKKLAENPTIRNLYLVTLNERIASALERRAFDTAKTRPALAAMAIGNLNTIRASADEAAAASERLERDSRRRR